MDNDKPKAWNYDQGDGVKDIIPGDEITEAKISQAQAAMGNAMAQELKEDQQYKEDTAKFVKQARNVNMWALGGSVGKGPTAIDQGVALGLGYYVIRLFYWFFHPIPGLRKSKLASFIFISSEVTIFILVLVIFLRWLSYP